MIHPPLKTRVVGSSIKTETKNPGHGMRDNHRAGGTDPVGPHGCPESLWGQAHLQASPL